MWTRATRKDFGNCSLKYMAVLKKASHKVLFPQGSGRPASTNPLFAPPLSSSEHRLPVCYVSNTHTFPVSISQPAASKDAHSLDNTLNLN